MFKRLIVSLICITFSFSNLQYVQADQEFSINQLPVPGTMIGKSPSFAPLSLKGLVVNPQKPLEFQFIVDTGKGSQDSASIKEEANRLVKYFLAGLTIPEGELWVNLSPYEKNRITTLSLGQTELGRDLLAQDYILKQLTASLIYPEKDLGKEFWKRVYTRAQKQFGTTNVPVNTFNKVWILPDQAQVYENGPAAYITKSTLKVMLDEDYLALQKHTAVRNDTASIGANIVREIVIPEITKEVNTGKNFAPLRQIYNAMILAKWYKETIQNSLLDAIYTNKNKVAGVNLSDPAVKEQIYERYLQAYKKGAFNYIKATPTPDGQVVPRKYFSGGTFFGNYTVRTDGAMTAIQKIGTLFLLIVGLGVTPNLASAQTNTPPQTSSYQSKTVSRSDFEKAFDNGGEIFDWLMQNGYFNENFGTSGHPKKVTALMEQKVDDKYGVRSSQILDFLMGNPFIGKYVQYAGETIKDGGLSFKAESIKILLPRKGKASKFLTFTISSKPGVSLQYIDFEVVAKNRTIATTYFLAVKDTNTHQARPYSQSFYAPPGDSLFSAETQINKILKGYITGAFSLTETSSVNVPVETPDGQPADEILIWIQKGAQDEQFSAIDLAGIDKYIKELPVVGNQVSAADEYFNLGLNLWKKGQNKDAIVAFQKAIDLNPGYTKAYYNLGLALGNMGRYQEAIAAYQKLVLLNPKYPDAYNNLGVVLWTMLRDQEAIVAYQKAIEINPKDAKAYYNLGLVLEGMGQKQEAISKFKKAIELNPKLTMPTENKDKAMLQALEKQTPNKDAAMLTKMLTPYFRNKALNGYPQDMIWLIKHNPNEVLKILPVKYTDRDNIVLTLFDEGAMSALLKSGNQPLIERLKHIVNGFYDLYSIHDAFDHIYTNHLKDFRLHTDEEKMTLWKLYGRIFRKTPRYKNFYYIGNWSSSTDLIRDLLTKKIFDQVAAIEKEGKDYDILYKHEEGGDRYDGPEYSNSETSDMNTVYVVTKKAEITIVPKLKVDLAMMSLSTKQKTNDKATLTTKGGIDLNPIAIHRTGKIIKIQFNPAQLHELMQNGFEGFTPVIISITPISNPFQLLNRVKV